HRPVMEALALLQQYRDRKSALFPLSEDVPLDGVVKDDWQELVLDEAQGGRINRISYEVCVLTTLREKVRCKEIWVAGAHRFRNPDEDLPQDFDARRDEYYAALKQPREAPLFVEQVRRVLDVSACKFVPVLSRNNHTACLIVTRSRVANQTRRVGWIPRIGQ